MAIVATVASGAVSCKKAVTNAINNAQACTDLELDRSYKKGTYENQKTKANCDAYKAAIVALRDNSTCTDATEKASLQKEYDGVVCPQ